MNGFPVLALDARLARPRADGDAELEALAEFLLQYRDTPETFRAYRRELERLVLWARGVRGCPVFALRALDVQAYLRFLAEPPADWIGPRQVRRRHPDWRPLSGPVGGSGRARAQLIVGAWFAFLARTGRIARNPLEGHRRPRAAARRIRVERHLPLPVLRRALAALEQAADAFDAATEPLARRLAERRLFVVRFLANTGLRRAELARADLADLLMHEDRECGADCLFLRVLGKGARERLVAINATAREALARYRTAWRAPARPGLDAGPLLLPARARDGRTHVGEATVYGIVRDAFAAAAARLRPDFPEDAALLARASPHWLRHSFGTEAARGAMPIELVSEQLGHASLDTTLLYRHTDLLERARAAETLAL